MTSNDFPCSQIPVITRTFANNGENTELFTCNIENAEALLAQTMAQEPRLVALHEEANKPGAPLTLLPRHAVALVNSVLAGNTSSTVLQEALFGREPPGFTGNRKKIDAVYMAAATADIRYRLNRLGKTCAEHLTPEQLNQLISTSTAFDPVRARISNSIHSSTTFEESSKSRLRTIEDKDWPPTLSQAAVVESFFIPLLRFWSRTHTYDIAYVQKSVS